VEPLDPLIDDSETTGGDTLSAPPLSETRSRLRSHPMSEMIATAGTSVRIRIISLTWSVFPTA
jgi:hypothetical protein